MSTSTKTLDAHDVGEKSPGLLQRIFDALVAGRRAEATRRINAYLASLDDARLRELGYDPAKVRAGADGSMPPSTWS